MQTSHNSLGKEERSYKWQSLLGQTPSCIPWGGILLLHNILQNFPPQPGHQTEQCLDPWHLHHWLLSGTDLGRVKGSTAPALHHKFYSKPILKKAQFVSNSIALHQKVVTALGGKIKIIPKTQIPSSFKLQSIRSRRLLICIRGPY